MTVSRGNYNVYVQLSPARLVATSNITASYYNGPTNTGVGATLTGAAATLTLDSVLVDDGDRVLVTGQTLPYQNGVYDKSTVDDLFVLTRSDDFQNIENLKGGQFITVSEGTLNAGSMWVLPGPLPGQFGILDNDIGPFANTSLGGGTNFKAATTTNIGGAGAGPIAVAVSGLTAASVVTATVEASTNPVSVVACTAGANTFNITFSADPGATCTVNYIAAVAPQ